MVTETKTEKKQRLIWMVEAGYYTTLRAAQLGAVRGAFPCYRWGRKVYVIPSEIEAHFKKGYTPPAGDARPEGRRAS